MVAPMTVYLNASAQAQLSQLKAANAVPLNRIDARSQTATKQQTSVTALKTEATQVRTALDKLKTAADAGKADAVATFVKEYNELINAFKSSTGKGAVLSTASELRFDQGNLRTPFQTSAVLSALKDAGVETTRDGLKLSGAAPGTFDVSAIATAFESTLSAVEGRLSSAGSRLDGQLSRLSQERSRVSLLVDRANTRTEQSYMRMYQVMQAAQSGENSGAVSLFG